MALINHMHLVCLIAVICCVDISGAQNTFGFACSRGDALCGTGTCNIETQACQCPTDGTTYNYQCIADGDQGYCQEPNVYGENCDIPRVGVYCVAGKMFLNVLTHGGNAKFTGSMYIKEKQGVSECTFTAATDAQLFKSKEAEYQLDNANDMLGYYLELPNTDATCGDATTQNVAKTADDPAHTLYTRKFYIQYNPQFQASLDQLVTASCKESTGASETTVYVGLGEVSNADDTNFEEVEISNEVGIVSLELLDGSFNPITSAVPLGTEVILRFNLGSGNEYSAIWLSGCSANNSLAEDNADFKKIDLIGDTGCPETAAVGVFKSFPSKPTVATGEPQVILMSIGAFRFTGPSNEVTFQCTVNLCKTGAEDACDPPSECSGFSSPVLEEPTETTTPTELTVSFASDKPNPHGVNAAVTLTCSGSGGAGSFTYSIREENDVTPPTFSATNTFTAPTGAVGIKSYVCEVKDQDGSTKTTDAVSVQVVGVFTSILTQTPTGDVKINTDVVLACNAAGGTGPYTYVIQKDSTEVSTVASFTDKSDTPATHTYKCVATDTGNAGVTTNSAELTVKYIDTPVVTVSGTPVNPVPENTDAVVTSTVTGGTAPYTYKWLKDGVEDTSVTANTITVAYQSGASVKVTSQVTDAAGVVVSEDYTVEFAGTAAPAAPISVTLASDKNNPLGLNEAVTLTCTASGGTGTLEYSIREDGAASSFAAESTLSLPTGAAGTKSYVCEVKDASGVTATSDPVSLQHVDSLTAVLTQKPSGEIKINTNVELSCKAAGGSGTYTYVIQRDGAQVATENTFTDTVATAGTRTFKCIATDTGNGDATAETEVTVKFIDPPVVTLLGAPVNPVPENTNAVVTSTVTGGTATYTYKWLKDGVEDTSVTANTITVAYQSGASVKVTSQVTDAAGVVVSEDYTVVFAAAATAAAQPLTASLTADKRNPVNVNEDVVLTCSGSGGTSPYAYQIFRGAETTPVSTVATFTATAADAKTETYKCRVTDDASNTADSDEVSVTTVSTLTVQAYAEPSGPVVKDTAVTLTCKAAGFTTGTPTYSWTRGAATDFNSNAVFTDSSSTAATVAYICVVTVDGNTESSTAVSVEFTETRKRRSVNIRFKRDTEETDRVSAKFSVYDPNAVTDGRIQVVKEKDCVNKADVTVVIIILAMFLFLLLVIATVLGAILLKSRQKVAALGHRGNEFENPVQTMAMPRLEINSSSAYSSSIGSHGV